PLTARRSAQLSGGSRSSLSNDVDDEAAVHTVPNLEQKREMPSQPVTVRIIRNDSSCDLFEIAEAQGLDHLCLDRRDVLVGLVGAKRRANDGAGSAATLGLTHELGDGLCDAMRIRASLPSNIDMKVLNRASGIWPTSP